MIDLYCGVSETKWNHHPVSPGRLVCVAPVYGSSNRTRRENRVSIPRQASVIVDSGAFSDGPRLRLSPEGALERQITHAEKYGYLEQVKAIASYDLLIDEKWVNGVRSKQRWGQREAETAVDETIRAARYLSENRIPGVSLILSAQGVEPRQYLRCAQAVSEFMGSDDWLGLGGWCITGKIPKRTLPAFRETVNIVIPWAAHAGIGHIHLWGVVYAPALASISSLCDKYGLSLSVDSVGPSLRPVFGEWGYADWKDPSYKRAPVEIRGLHRAAHVNATRKWLQGFDPLRYLEPWQPSLFYQG